jgi:hypothetical protein
LLPLAPPGRRRTRSSWFARAARSSVITAHPPEIAGRTSTRTRSSTAHPRDVKAAKRTFASDPSSGPGRAARRLWPCGLGGGRPLGALDELQAADFAVDDAVAHRMLAVGGGVQGGGSWIGLRSRRRWSACSLSLGRTDDAAVKADALRARTVSVRAPKPLTRAPARATQPWRD